VASPAKNASGRSIVDNCTLFFGRIGQLAELDPKGDVYVDARSIVKNLGRELKRATKTASQFQTSVTDFSTRRIRAYTLLMIALEGYESKIETMDESLRASARNLAPSIALAGRMHRALGGRLRALSHDIEVELGGDDEFG
jgi:hypothetical protein